MDSRQYRAKFLASLIRFKEVIDIQNEIIKQIPNFEDYYISNTGNVYSTKTGSFKLLKQFTDSSGNYMMIGLQQNGKPKKALVHRLVAIAFLPNPKNLPEVDHKDKNKHNNNVENLSWCTRKDNLNHSYSTKSPTRNYCVAKLYKDEIMIGEFDGIAKAAKYAKQKFGTSESSLIKYLKSGNIEIKAKTNGKYQYKNHKQTKSYQCRAKRVYKNGYFQKEFKTSPDNPIYMKKIQDFLDFLFKSLI